MGDEVQVEVVDINYETRRVSLSMRSLIERAKADEEEAIVAENAEYGSSGCTLAEIIVPSGTPAIRLDLMPDVQNEPDEIILAPVKLLVTKVNQNENKIYMTCCKSLY